MLRRLDPATAGDETLNWMYDVRAEAHREAAPAEPFEPRDVFVGRLRHPVKTGRHWAWMIGGVGFASLDIDADTAVGFVRLFVATTHRRRGAGRELADAVIEQARAAGCPALTSLFGAPGGAALTRALGGRTGHASIRSVLTMPAREAPVPVPGFEVRSWRGLTPEHLLESFALARQAIADAPFEGGLNPAAWTPEKVREIERAVVARGVDLRTTVVLEGERVVAATELRAGTSGALASTEDTSVVRDRRGLGLGRLVKAESLRLLALDRPDITQVTTSNEETNAPMLAINRRLGFTPMSRWTSAFLALS